MSKEEEGGGFSSQFTLDQYFQQEKKYSCVKMKETSKQTESTYMFGGGFEEKKTEEETYEDDYESDTSTGVNEGIAGMSLGDYFTNTAEYSETKMKAKSALLDAEEKKKEQKQQKQQPATVQGLTLEAYLMTTSASAPTPTPKLSSRKPKKKKTSQYYRDMYADDFKRRSRSQDTKYVPVHKRKKRTKNNKKRTPAAIQPINLSTSLPPLM